MPDFTLQLYFFTEVNSYQAARLTVLPGKKAIISWVALYEGEYTLNSLPPYIAKDYAVELTECQRYYKVFKYEGSVYDTCFYGCVTDALNKVQIQTDTLNMRATPTATLTGKVTLRGVSGYLNSGSFTGISVAINECRRDSIIFENPDGTTFTNTVNNTPVQMYLPAGSKLEFSADL